MRCVATVSPRRQAPIVLGKMPGLLCTYALRRIILTQSDWVGLLSRTGCGSSGRRAGIGISLMGAWVLVGRDARIIALAGPPHA